MASLANLTGYESAIVLGVKLVGLDARIRTAHMLAALAGKRVELDEVAHAQKDIARVAPLPDRQGTSGNHSQNTIPANPKLEGLGLSSRQSASDDIGLIEALSSPASVAGFLFTDRQSREATGQNAYLEAILKTGKKIKADFKFCEVLSRTSTAIEAGIVQLLMAFNDLFDRHDNFKLAGEF